MKLFNMTADDGADAIILAAPYMEELLSDDELMKMIVERKKSTDRTEATQLGGIFVIKLVYRLLKEHRQATFGLVGALNGKTPEEIGVWTFVEIFETVKGLIDDVLFYDFFPSSEQSEQETQSELSDKQEESQ